MVEEADDQMMVECKEKEEEAGVSMSPSRAFKT
jgi:hypothetical protein